MILYATLVLCSIGAAVLVYRFDLYDREPLPLVGLAAVLGAGAMALAARTEHFTFERLGLEDTFALAGVAVLQEETLKLLVVVALAVLARRHFNDPMDGIIYGSMAGLGAALEEGVAMLRGRPPGGAWLAPEEIVRLCGHLVMGGIGGFGVGQVRLRRRGGVLALGLGFGAAVCLHFGWDILALGGTGAPNASLFGAALMLGGFLLYGRLVSVASSWSQQVFSPGRVRRLPFLPFRRTGDGGGR